MQRWWRPIALGLGLGWAVVVLIHLSSTVGRPVDAWCYYAMDPTDPWRQDGCFLYSPPIALLMTALQQAVPFEAFYTSIRVIEVIALALITGPAIGLTLLIPAVAIEINAANVNLLLVAAVLLGFRFPWTWAFVILTKVTPGIGLLWFAARREWRALAIAGVATALFVGASWAIAPWMWSDYLAALRAEPDSEALTIWVRLPFAVALVLWGARTDRRWTVIAAVFLAMPRWYYLTPVILVGLFPLVRFPRPLPWAARRRIPRQAVAAGTSEGRTYAAPSS